MTQLTIEKLNKMNKDFYSRISKYWNNSEASAWYGWRTLVDYLSPAIKPKKTLSILDLGCGNARFATFMRNSFPLVSVDYVGLDTDLNFLENGEDRRSDEFAGFELIQADLVSDKWVELLNGKKFDLVVMFGILHHIPGGQDRSKLFAKASKLLTPKGNLVFTGWRFLDKERLLKRVLPNDSVYQKHILTCHGISTSDLENNDYILDWVKYEYSVRYAHYVSQDEVAAMTQNNKLKINKHFIDDSLDNDQNNYWITSANLE